MTMGTVSWVLSMRRSAFPCPFHSNQRTQPCEYHSPDFSYKSYLHVQLLKHTKHDFMHALCALPKTQHDFSFFVVDMCFQVVKIFSSLLGRGRKPHEMMLYFSVNGVFKE
ncbi:NXF3, partial [Cervus elaphus hippelaphus]